MCRVSEPQYRGFNGSEPLMEHPDIVNYIYEHPTALDLKMKGFWISDRTLARLLVLRRG